MLLRWGCGRRVAVATVEERSRRRGVPDVLRQQRPVTRNGFSGECRTRVLTPTAALLVVYWEAVEEIKHHRGTGLEGHGITTQGVVEQ